MNMSGRNLALEMLQEWKTDAELENFTSTLPQGLGTFWTKYGCVVSTASSLRETAGRRTRKAGPEFCGSRQVHGSRLWSHWRRYLSESCSCLAFRKS